MIRNDGCFFESMNHFFLHLLLFDKNKKMKREILSLCCCFLLGVVALYGKTRTFDMTEFGLYPDTRENASPYVRKALEAVRQASGQYDRITLKFSRGRYDFFEEGSGIHTYFISNHDQDNPKRVGLPIEDLDNFTLDGQGALFVFHGRMLPVSLINGVNCTLKNFSVDFDKPHITQVKVKVNDSEEGITFEVTPSANCRINEDGRFESYDENWVETHGHGMAFEEKTKRIVYRTSDIGFDLSDCRQINANTFLAPNWKDSRLVPGTVVTMRPKGRPTPGLFMYHDKDTKLKNINIHYAEGMGLLAQLCENITLDSYNVCLKGENDPRYFTTQADATHFSGCKGKIITRNSLYENMMDDAINVHGTYLKVIGLIDDRTVIGRYMHPQAWGFEWGGIGDEVQFVSTPTMEVFATGYTIEQIKPYDKATTEGAKEFIITFDRQLDKMIGTEGSFGMENLEWTPEVVFTHNVIRNNRARGTLFSTPRKTVIENNLFDHTSGAAILLCGDCNGWFETGACRDITIRGNKFINSLTNMFQFTEAVISIYPEIPDLARQKKYFHGGNGKGVVIENNLFETFDQPIVYAKSLDGLVIRHNKIVQNNDFKPFHHNDKRFFFQRVINYTIEKNRFNNGFDPLKDIRNEE